MVSTNTRSNRIREIAQQIATLSAELQSLLSLDDQASAPPVRPVSPPSRPAGSFFVGDIVRMITNKYGSNFNKRGRVLKVHRDSVDLHLLDESQYTTVTKRKRNVQLLSDSSQ